MEASSFNFALIVGPALAGTLSAAFGPEAPLIVEIALTLLALVLILLVPGLDTEGRPAEDSSSVFDVARQGIRLIWEVPALRGVTATGMLGLAGLGLLTVGFPLFAVDHLGAERSAAGYLWAAFALGSMLGALTLVRLQHRWPPEQIVVGGIAAFGALMLLWPIQSSLALMIVVVVMAGLADGPGPGRHLRHAPALRARRPDGPGVHHRGGAQGGLVLARVRAGGPGGAGGGLGGRAAHRRLRAVRGGGGRLPAHAAAFASWRSRGHPLNVPCQAGDLEQRG